MAKALPTRPDSRQRAVQMPQNVLDPLWFLFLSQLLDVVADRVEASQMVVKTGVPTAADVPDGEFRIIKNTTGPTYSLVVNDGGSLKSVSLT
jgi:hypothetical protein